MQYPRNLWNLINQTGQKLGFPHRDTAIMHFKYPKIKTHAQSLKIPNLGITKAPPRFRPA